MAKPVRVRKLDRPPHLRHGTHDLAVDEVAESSDPHEEGRRNDEGVGKEQEGLPVLECKECRADRAAEHKPVGGHPPEPKGGNQPEMRPVEGPFVEPDLDGAAADEDADGHEQAQTPDLPKRQVQASMTASQKEMNLQEPEGKAQPVPPQVHAGDVEQNRIDLVDVGSEHAFPLSRPSHRSPMKSEASVSNCCGAYRGSS